MSEPVRILVLWEHPPLLSAEEARAWAERNVAPLRESESVERLELVPRSLALRPTLLVADEHGALCSER
jgi:hypothetical protein